MSRVLDDLVNWAPQLWAGVELTVLITLASMAVALIIGLVLALAQLNPRRRILAWSSYAFVELIRGSPLLLQLFYIFYVFPFFGLKLSTFTAGVLGLAINYGAYLSEVFRAGIEAVDNGQWEAARSLGMPMWVIMAKVVLPQALRIVIPPVGNYFISLFKDTALVSTISISELLFTGQLLAAETFKYLEIYSFIFTIYIVISYPASLGVKWLERRLRIVRPAIAARR